jgi:NADP-dependent 3-hydroxy acid dehydrogenase YdfG
MDPSLRRRAVDYLGAMTHAAPLTDRVALVTGASAGIGRATARHLAARGAAVVVSARRADRLDALAEEIAAAGGVAHALPADAADRAAIDRLWADAADRLGRPADLVVVNAGRGLQGSVLTSDASAWRGMFELNVLGAMHLMKVAAEALRATPGPRDVVVLGSVVGSNVSPFSGVYGATKFAIESAAEGLRREVGGAGVRVTTVKPGVVASEFQEVAGYDHDTFGKVVEKFGPMLTPDDVARCIGFACEQPANVHVNTLTVRPVGQDYP